MPLRRLLKFMQRQECLKWWEWALGVDYESARQFFSPCSGRRGSCYPSAESSSVLLEIGECRGAYAAFATGELAGFYKTVYLEWSDVQAHRVDSDRIVSHLRAHFNIRSQHFQPLENLYPIGHCPVGDRSIYASLYPDSEKNLAIAAGIHGPETAGCIIFPERIDHVEPLLRGKGIAAIFLDEACSCKSPSCGRKCAGLKSELSRQIEEIKRERIEDSIKSRAQRQIIEEMADGPEKFIAGLRARLSGKEADLFTLLIHKESDEYGSLRLLSYAEVGNRLKKRVSKQAVGAQYKKLEETQPDVWAFIEAIRNPGKDTVYSGLSPSERRELGIDESYNYNAG